MKLNVNKETRQIVIYSVNRLLKCPGKAVDKHVLYITVNDFLVVFYLAMKRNDKIQLSCVYLTLFAVCRIRHDLFTCWTITHFRPQLIIAI